METQLKLFELPLEVILEIFSWCSKPDLLNLTLVCKDFNEIISNSSKIMENVSIHLSPEKLSFTEPWNGVRKYSHIIVHCHHPEIATILKHNRIYLTNLEVKDIKANLESLRKTFLKFPNLKHLKMESINIRFTSRRFFQGPLPAFELDSLILNGDRKVLLFLMDSQTKKLTLNSTMTMSDELMVLRMFLQKQEMLKELVTCGMHVDYPMFAGGNLNQVKFRLEKIVMKNLSEIPVPNFKIFLDNHRESLKEVSIMNLANKGDFCDDVLNHLSTFQNLKRLVLTSVDPTFQPMPFVEELLYLRVRGYKDLTWSDKFLNVQRLIIACDNNEKIKEVTNLKKLKSLVIFHATTLPSISFPITLQKIRTIRKPITDIKYFGHETEKLKGLLMEEEDGCTISVYELV